ncbi:MAG: hypothetical protein J5I93_30340, partial [Pirellulaceae bacterium]|nr:hypothetical protein [Pirellulaceae bacterium]
PIAALNPAVPMWLAELIQRLLATDPQRRPCSAAEVAAIFRQRLVPAIPADAARGTPQQVATTVPPTAPPDRWLRQVGLGAAGLLAVCAVVLLLRSQGATTRIEVPDGATVQVRGDGTVEVQLPEPAADSKAAEPARRPETNPHTAYGQPSSPPGTPIDAAAWERSVQRLPADQQVRAVAERLQQLNPDFNGQLQPTIEADQVIGLQFVADHVTDLSPLRALNKLTSLDCGGSNFELPAKLADLAPLHGLRLERLHVPFTQVADLAPLRRMPLRSLGCARTQVYDLRPLTGMPLRDLSVQNSNVMDLTPLRGLPLDSLNISHTRVTDIAPLSGMPLDSLYLDGTAIGDLSPLGTLRLFRLNWRGYDPHRAAHADAVRAIATLEEINSRPAAQFWSNPLLEAP